MLHILSLPIFHSHRIGQQGRVRCLYFIGRGTLDDVLWKLIGKKYRDLGAFVEGKENMDIALGRELEDGEEEEILKMEDNDGGEGAGKGKKRKAQDVFNELFDAEVTIWPLIFRYFDPQKGPFFIRSDINIRNALLASPSSGLLRGMRQESFPS